MCGTSPVISVTDASSIPGTACRTCRQTCRSRILKSSSSFRTAVGLPAPGDLVEQRRGRRRGVGPFHVCSSRSATKCRPGASFPAGHVRRRRPGSRP
jgi:hypothetical protein